ncbi:MAG TPA: RNA 2',3'-cyclic phosphodiesterase [Opitutaceae bacterium]|nr:RNA 2',3'-cyclic phosphodiesterase [Opitutaceae bacterium]
MPRLFTAIALPDVVRDTIAYLPAPVPGITWIPEDRLHLTLRFLGELPDDKVDLVIERLSPIRIVPFVLPVEGLGTFPPKGPPRVIWVGIGKGHPRLHQLRQRTDDTLLTAGINFDVRTFNPHVTLGRCSEPDPDLLASWLASRSRFECPPFRVNSFNLYSSDLTSPEPIYTLIHTFNLSDP